MNDKFENLLDSGIRNISQAFYDRFVEANAKFRARAGLKVTIVRESMGECCSWCSDLAGTYSYDKAPKDVYARHRDCNCVVSTKTEKGTWQDAHTRREFDTYRENRIARAENIEKERKRAGINKQRAFTRPYKNDIRNSRPLSQDQIKECLEYAKYLGMPSEKIRYSDYQTTVYGASIDALIIGTDVYPRATSKKANGRISFKGAIAHEIVGHRETCIKGTELTGVLDEAQASFRAARFAPGLHIEDRMLLIRDGLDRLHGEGIKLKQVRHLLDIQKR